MSSLGFKAAAYGHGDVVPFRSPSTGKGGNLMLEPSKGSSVARARPWLEDSLFLGKELTWKRFPEGMYTSETTGGHVERKFMPLKLAMQREHAYRKKKEASTRQTRNEFQESHMTNRGETSTLKTVRIRRETPLENLPSYSQQTVQLQPAVQFCKTCNIVCSGEFNLSQHYKGRKHKAKLGETKIGRNLGTEPVICQLCNIPCMNEHCYLEHLGGKKHAACLQAISNVKIAKSGMAKEVSAIGWERSMRDDFLEGGKKQCRR